MISICIPVLDNIYFSRWIISRRLFSLCRKCNWLITPKVYCCCCYCCYCYRSIWPMKYVLPSNSMAVTFLAYIHKHPSRIMSLCKNESGFARCDGIDKLLMFFCHILCISGKPFYIAQLFVATHAQLPKNWNFLFLLRCNAK